jgi:cyclohexanecarboxylate-CoA ligase
VHAAEIEEALLMHPHIRQAAVIGIPDERLGERGCAIVSLKEGTTFSLEEMQQYLLKTGMAKYKLPEYLKILNELPTTASGKVSKGVLRKQYVQLEVK